MPVFHRLAFLFRAVIDAFDKKIDFLMAIGY
jgi:hypothetical protein